ncbi:MAG: hypothetical protein Q7T73_03425 [Beijerinckiaceae bacterium]|nr:hypothetical protein [Beijerinckiaceae bacterium]
MVALRLDVATPHHVSNPVAAVLVGEDVHDPIATGCDPGDRFEQLQRRWCVVVVTAGNPDVGLAIYEPMIKHLVVHDVLRPNEVNDAALNNTRKSVSLGAVVRVWRSHHDGPSVPLEHRPMIARHC